MLSTLLLVTVRFILTVSEESSELLGNANPIKAWDRLPQAYRHKPKLQAERSHGAICGRWFVQIRQ